MLSEKQPEQNQENDNEENDTLGANPYVKDLQRSNSP